jgi:hypothetical protein
VTSITTSGGDVHRIADEAWAAMVEANSPEHPQVLVRGGDLTRISNNEGTVSLVPHTEISLMRRMSETASYGYMKKDANDEWHWIGREPPPNIAKMIKDDTPDRYVGAPRINRVVDVPVFGANGQLQTAPGYHAGSRTYYAPAEGMAEIGEIPTDEANCYVAKDFLWNHLLGEFCYADDASKTNALAYMLTPFVRDMIAGPVPALLSRAHVEGTGKTLLAEMTMFPGCGDVAANAIPENAAEWKKALLTYLLTAPNALFFDNVQGQLGNSALNSALTAKTYGDRILGTSTNGEAAVRNLWVFTGNNMNVTGEMSRRSVAVNLDAAVEEPWNRPATDFRHPDLSAWAHANRTDLVWACLVLCKAALEARADEYMYHPNLKRTKLSFTKWAETLGFIVAWHGYEGFLENDEDLHEDADEERHDDRAFFNAWAARTTEPLTPAELADLVTDMPLANPLRDALPPDLRNLTRDELGRQLPYYLRKRKGRIYAGLRLERVPDPSKRAATQWVLVRQDAQSSG